MSAFCWRLRVQKRIGSSFVPEVPTRTRIRARDLQATEQSRSAVTPMLHIATCSSTSPQSVNGSGDLTPKLDIPLPKEEQHILGCASSKDSSSSSNSPLARLSPAHVRTL